MRQLALLFALFVFMTSPLFAADESAGDSPPAASAKRGPQLGEEQVQRFRLGMIITAQGGPCKGIIGTAPMPTDWPEQTVEIVEEDVSSFVDSVDYRVVAGTVKQMCVTVKQLPANEEARALMIVEVRRNALVAPDETDIYKIPEKLDRTFGLFLGASPGIEARNPKIKKLAKEITADHETAWDQVRALYDYVREKVEYVEGPFRGGLAALRNGKGDCEEMSSLFIALCRAHGVPARTVWVPGHCYPEFYLVDDQGAGYWFPCQAAGAAAFGGIPEHRPILQKGDNFRDPERPRESQRYLSEYLTGAGGKPKVKFVRELVSGAGK
ncbi:MAG: transglutaminase-like domain-containing protein [Pirellulales bacterium]|nr:transglutaminase-like domain-containing protein [Pirellulales bacterium]